MASGITVNKYSQVLGFESRPMLAGTGLKWQKTLRLHIQVLKHLVASQQNAQNIEET
jgi:hypothetical protein